MAGNPVDNFIHEGIPMLRITRTFANSLALLVVAAAMAPATANAWPIGKIFHLHSATSQSQDTRITVGVGNHSAMFRDVRVGGRVYTVLPNHGLTIKAPVGTQVYAVSNSLSHRAGD